VNKFIMIVKQVGSETTWEEPVNTYPVYDSGRTIWKEVPKRTDLVKAKKYATMTIEYFNSTLRLHETARELVDVKEVEFE
jgi:hypothetical protein